LFEFDRRFEVFGEEFIYYDFEQPIRLPGELRISDASTALKVTKAKLVELKGVFTRIICDPPFLSEICQTKAALTVRWLSSTWNNEPSTGVRIIVCTGERMRETILKLYAKAGVRTTTFEPHHSKGLSNEFLCYANFETPEVWHWR
jgi:EEF1A lysine methyltransferase 1